MLGGLLIFSFLDLHNYSIIFFLRVSQVPYNEGTTPQHWVF